MNVRERLKEAYENVSFNADKTWTNSPDSYHKNNLELYLTERHIQRKKLHRNRPRTVRECIPKSRLAQYSNYIYNESREMSYASCATDSETNLPSIFSPTEPWEMPEVGELFKWFLKNLPEGNFSRLEGCYESPLLNVKGFEDKILKIQITEDRVKNIWKKNEHSSERETKTVVNFYTSPMNSFFLFNDLSYNQEWFRNISISKDFEQLEQLTKSLEEQNSYVSECLAGNNNEAAPAGSEIISTEILYSEVLQGLSPSRKFVSSIKTEQPNRVLTIMDDAVSINQDNFTNFTILNSQRTTQEESTKSDDFNQNNDPPKVSQFSTVPSQSSNKFVPQKTSTANIYFQNDNNARYKYPTVNQLPMESFPRHNNNNNRSSLFHPLTTSHIQQTYFYSPVQTLQRWVPSNFTTSCYPTQIFASSWLTQSPVISHTYDVNRIFGPAPVNTIKVSGDTDLCSCNNRRENCSFGTDFVDDSTNQLKEENVTLEEHPVSASISEELEIQALEQYSNSNENFYQELERQAAEQYSNSPE